MKKLKTSDLGRLSPAEYRKAPKIPLVIVLDDVRSGYNVGSVFRTADAFRILALHLCGITGKPPQADIHKTALGATESVEWKYFHDVRDSLSALKVQGFRIYAIEQVDKSIQLENFCPAAWEKIALVFGHEVKGVNEKVFEFVDGCIEIPQFGTKHSLNIAVSAGIVLWQIFPKLKPLLVEPIV
jgi:23S rRNA (guanosine2251-2'-O)-methyltransferase